MARKKSPRAIKSEQSPMRGTPGGLEPDRGHRVGFDARQITGKPGTAYTFLPDANGDIHMEKIPLPKGRAMPTLSAASVASMSERAQKLPWCTKALDDATIAKLAPKGTNMILAAWRHTTEDWLRDNVRVHMLLSLRGQESVPHERMIDFTSYDFGIFIGAWAQRVAHDVTPLEGLLLPEGSARFLRKPTWAAARSFEKVWARAERGFRLYSHARVAGGRLEQEFSADKMYGPVDLAKMVAAARSAMTLHQATLMPRLSEAQLVVVEPEWVQGLGDNPPTEMVVEHFREGRVPFDMTFLDFGGPGGLVPTLPGTGEFPVRIAGALLMKELDGEMAVTPFGGMANLAAPDEWCNPRGEPYNPMGRVVFGTTPLPGEPGSIRCATVNVDDEDTDAAPMFVMDIAAFDPDLGIGQVELPISAATGMSDQAIVDWAALTVASALRALRVLYMLQGANVELVEAKLHPDGKRLAKRAEKRGWDFEVGLMVAVRWKKRIYYRPPGAEVVDEGRGYSHAFWVSGHPKFYPLGTRMADALAEADPTKLVEHPVKGLCRMIWTPPFMKGLRDPSTQEEREPVEKVRKVVGDAYEVM